jgi:kumamolisin
MSHFVSSGDSGAYTCGQTEPAATAYVPSIPTTTGVGGTSVFLGKGGVYHRELAWGNPFSKTGGGGGLSRLYPRPPYQNGLGIPGKGRAVPDVSGLADFYTGWHIIAGGRHAQVGGTSASAPMWAGIAALINESLRKKKLPRIGFANPGLYWIAARNAKYKAFHDVTGGNNLLYAAKKGFDMATGLGTPDAAALNRGFADYQRQASQP